MANVSGNGTIWNLPNYAGEIFTADLVKLPFLGAIGGLNGGKETGNFEFPVDSEYVHNSAAQPAITETASLTAPTAVSYVRGQVTNVTQIFQEKVSISYVKQSNQKRLSGLNTAGQQNNVISEKDFQIAKTLEKISRDIEQTFLNGVYQIATNAGVANKTRGMIPAITTNAVAAGTVQLSKALMDSLFLLMFNNGAQFNNMMIYCNGFQRQLLSRIYGFQTADKNVGGISVSQIETDFGTMHVAPAHRFMTTSVLGVFDMSVVDAVFQPVPEKGNFFYEELAKTGAAEEGQIFGQVGLSHGPEWCHGKITGLTTS